MLRKMALTRSAFGLLVFVLLSTQTEIVLAEAPVVLRWKFRTGEKLAFVMRQDLEQSMLMAGQNIDTTNESTTWLTWTVEAVDAGGKASIRSTIDRMKMLMKIPMQGEVVVDTDQEQDPEGVAAQIGQSIRPLVGIQISSLMDQRGQISDVQIPKDALQKLNNSAVASIGFSDATLSEMTQKFAIQFPAEAVEVGRSWEQAAEVPFPFGKMTSKNVYTYRGEVVHVGKPLHRMDVALTLDFKPGEGPAQVADVKIKEQSAEGTLYFDNQAGKLHSSTLKQAMALQVVAMGQTIEQKIAQTVTMTCEPIQGPGK